jgi:hypothetical protein
MAKPPPYGQKRDGHPHLRERRAFGHPTPTGGCLHGQRRGETPLAIPHLRAGAYMAKEGVGSASLFGHPLRAGAYMAKGGRDGPDGQTPPFGPLAK